MINRSAWQGMSTAPRDGTIIEIECRYGIEPWRGLFRWELGHSEIYGGGLSDDPDLDGNWRPAKGRWMDADAPTQGIGVGDSNLVWRPR
jgi:hypothetical protein